MGYVVAVLLEEGGIGCPFIYNCAGKALVSVTGSVSCLVSRVTWVVWIWKALGRHPIKGGIALGHKITSKARKASLLTCVLSTCAPAVDLAFHVLF